MHRLPGLDLLRALAVIWVMLFHSFLVGGLGDNFEWLSRFGWAGVDMFFVLSGFLIGAQWMTPLARGERPQFAAFYARRAWRVLPAFVVVLAIYVTLPDWREAPGLQPWWQFATFTMNLLIDYQHNRAFSHAWSLCVEEHFYLVFPVLALWLSRRQSMGLTMGLCVALLVAGVGLRTGVWLHNDATAPDRPWYVEDLYYPTWSRLDGLLAGVVLAMVKVYRPVWWNRLLDAGNLALMLGISLVAVALWLFRDRVGLPANSVGWPLLSAGLAMVVLAAASPRSWLGRWQLPGATWIAAISYSLYLSHKLAMHAVHQALPDNVQGGWRFAVHAVAILATGALLYYAVERPGLRWRDRRMKDQALRTRFAAESPRTSANAAPQNTPGYH